MHTAKFGVYHFLSIPLSAKVCSMSVNTSVQDLEIYGIISRPVPMSYTRGIIRRDIVGCPSNVHPQVWCLSASSLSAKLSSMCVHRSVQVLEIYSIISRLVPISEAGGIIGRL